MQSRCYARADRLDLNLARQTRGYYIEPENLLTITVPKQICLQRMHFQRGGIRHFRKLSPNELGLSRQNICIRPASWSKNEQNIPNQFPCYGFFGYSTEINDPNDAHDDHFHLFLISNAHGSWGVQKSHGEDPQKNHHGCEAIRGSWLIQE